MNVTANQINFQKHLEDKRHNIVTEALGYDTLGETIRHNKSTETETVRHNQATEYETNRHNLATEKVEQGKLEVQRGQLAESIRHNKSVEAETHRSNVARETETNRANLRNEEIASKNVSTRVLELIETQEHNDAQEQLAATGLMVDLGGDIIKGTSSLAGSVFNAATKSKK